MSAPSKTDAVQAQLDGLAALDRGDLFDLWERRFGDTPPKGISRRLLERAAAFAIQARVYGGLKPRMKKMLLSIADDDSAAMKAAAPEPKPDLPPGTRLLREWNGRTHQVDVVENGFVWNDRSYTSLSAVARAITGARWSGPRFFGL